MTGTLQAGGAERVLSEITARLTDDYDVTIIMYYDREVFYTIDERVKIVSLEHDTKTKSIIRNVACLRKMVKRENPDLFVSFMVPFNILSFFSLLGLKVPIVLCERNDPEWWTRNILKKVLRYVAYRQAKGVVFQTRVERDFFNTRTQRHGVVIPNPSFMPKEYVGKALRTEKQQKIVCVSRIHPQKNLAMLVSVFANLHPQYPDYKLMMYGTGKDENIRTLQSLIDSVGMTHHIVLCGAQQKLFDAISDAQFFVMSSDYEGMSNAVMEAISLGLPVVTTNVSGTEEMVEHEKNGLVVPMGDAKALQDAMQTMIASPELCTQMGRHSVDVALRFNCEEIMKQWRKRIRMYCKCE